MTDAAGDTSEYYYDDQGNLLKYVDADGNASYATYTSSGQLASITGPTGLTETFTYDSNGNLTSATNPLGETTSSPTRPRNLLASVDQRPGRYHQLQVRQPGDLTAVHYPDSTVETATYDALGDPLTLTDQDGQVTSYTYNAAGQVTERDPGRRHQMAYYATTAEGDLISATDPTGTTTLTYNTAGELTGVAYPTGLVAAVHLQLRRPAHQAGRDVRHDRHRDGQLRIQRPASWPAHRRLGRR